MQIKLFIVLSILLIHPCNSAVFPNTVEQPRSDLINGEWRKTVIGSVNLQRVDLLTVVDHLATKSGKLIHLISGNEATTVTLQLKADATLGQAIDALKSQDPGLVCLTTPRGLMLKVKLTPAENVVLDRMHPAVEFRGDLESLIQEYVVPRKWIYSPSSEGHRLKVNERYLSPVSSETVLLNAAEKCGIQVRLTLNAHEPPWIIQDLGIPHGGPRIQLTILPQTGAMGMFFSRSHLRGGDQQPQTDEEKGTLRLR